MNRPEPHELQLALLISKIDSPTASAAAKLLALEVLALQADRAWCGTNHGNNMCPVGLQKVRELQAERQNMIDALGVGEDIEHGRDVIEACEALRQSIRLALDDLYTKNETIERVEALLSSWNAENGTMPNRYPRQWDDCATDLHTALKGPQ